MRLVYFDEVKPNPKSFPDFLIAGYSISSDRLPELAGEFGELVEVAFAEMGVPAGTEIHAQHIYHGKASFKGKDLSRRIQFLSDVLRLLEPEDIRLVFAHIHVDRLQYSNDALGFAFTHFCERAHNTLHDANLGMMIGDLDRATRNSLWTSFSEFRKNGTPWAFGKELPKFIDTVHFVDSRVCEMVQIADVLAFHWSDGGRRTGYAANLMREQTKEINLFPSSYKHWPPI